MPLLSDEERRSINERLQRENAIRAVFEDRQCLTIHCYLCNWASNGLTIEEAEGLNRRHEKRHLETAELESIEVSPAEFFALVHDHECDMGYCSCKCGCQDGRFCRTVLGPLCSGCLIREQQGDTGHGERPENVSWEVVIHGGNEGSG